MRKPPLHRTSGARRIAVLAVLCAFILCACGPVQPEPTPFMEASATQIRIGTVSHSSSPSAAGQRRDQLSQDLFSDAATGAPGPAPSRESAPSEEPSPSAAPVYEDGSVHMRAVWIASVLNIDFPAQPGEEPEEIQEHFRTILDNMRKWGLDTAIVQVRPMADALYPSAINPWSSFLTGTQGEDPGWDPLAFMVEEAHKQDIALHVWLNPYRVTHPSAGFTVSDLAEGSLAKQHPEWLIEHDNTVYYDPAREEVKQHIVDTVQEIVDNYDVDGVHFDDYFYPAEYPLPEGADRDGIIAQERRANVNEMLRRVKEVCDAAPQHVVFGVSPFGIWKNSTTDPQGSDTNGNESYYAMAADSVRWIREEIIDYIAPQLYWPIGHNLADYDTLAKWWAKQVDGTNVSLVIGQGIYNEEIATEISEELELNAQIPQITGSIFFSYSDFVKNPAVADAVAAFYSAHAETNPPPISSLEQSIPPSAAGSSGRG